MPVARQQGYGAQSTDFLRLFRIVSPARAAIMPHL